MARSRSSLGILTPLLLVIFAAVIWSVAWFFLADAAETRIAAAMKQASQQGWTIVCPEQSVGGFPFRIEFDCTAPQLVIENAKGRVTVQSEQLKVVALIYNHDRAIAEFTGPTKIDTFQLGGQRRTYRILTDSARASVDFSDGEALGLSVVMTSVNANIPSLDLLNAKQSSSVLIERAAFHARKAPALGAALDLAVTLDNAQFSGELPQSYFDLPDLPVGVLNFVGRMTKTGSLQGNSMATRAASWQAAGGELRIQRLKIDAPALDVEISGVARLDASGRLEGKFKGIFGKLKQLVADLKSRGVLNDDGARLAAGAIGLLARPVKGSSKAELPINVSAGDVFIGPVKTMVLPSLF